MIHVAVVLAVTAAAGGADGGAPVLFVLAAELAPGDAGVPPSDLELLDPTTLQAIEGLGLVPDAGWVELGPGCYLPLASCLTKGKHVADLEAQNLELRGNPGGFKFSDVFRAGWVGFALGALQAVLAIGAVCYLATGNVLCR